MGKNSNIKKTLLLTPPSAPALRREGLRALGATPVLTKLSEDVLLAKLLVFRDITPLKQLQQSEQERVALEERQRIVRDLHDAVNQLLFSAQITAEMLLRQRQTMRQETLWTQLAHLHLLIKSALAEMRNFVAGIAP